MTQLPLHDVARSEGIIWVLAPSSMSDLSQIEVRLGSFLVNLAKFTKEFEYPTLSYGILVTVL